MVSLQASITNVAPRWCKPLLAMVLFSCIGCGEEGPRLIEVEGVVTYQGSPVTQGTIHFGPAPESTAKRPAVGNLGSDGRYTLRSLPNREGIEPGEYVVTVQSYTGSHLDGSVEYLVPEIYTSVETSGLTATVGTDEGSRIERDFSLDAPK